MFSPQIASAPTCLPDHGKAALHADARDHADHAPACQRSVQASVGLGSDERDRGADGEHAAVLLCLVAEGVPLGGDEPTHKRSCNTAAPVPRTATTIVDTRRGGMARSGPTGRNFSTLTCRRALRECRRDAAGPAYGWPDEGHGADMRESFHEELNRLSAQLRQMCTLAAEAIRRASRSLLIADLDLAEQVIAADAEIDWARADCESHAQALLALQAPKAHDLRIILATIYCAERLERMGDLAAHVADTARFAHPHHAVPAQLEYDFAEMADAAAGMADRLAELIERQCPCGFADLADTDQTIDTIHAHVLTLITSDQWLHGVQTAINLALLARFYERFGDHAVAIANRLGFAATGELPIPTHT
ncbi:phosphate signaling complex protein PhoU [Amycolatopsis sp. NPDC047767]|uniref:phosphate signaling complex protein PhoU n=1 Tax=Amycolatopsis sp. NPDC047767 TaxID=3156765 RepID=UPI0034544A4D